VIDILIYAGITLLCLAGLFLSSLTFSGTWCVLLASVLAWWKMPGTVGPATILIFATVCIAVELIEALASYMGVTKRGGSGWAGIAALLGGLLGTALGTAVLPIIGSFAGLLLGSFTAAFMVERARQKKTEAAAHIAFGAVLAKLLILLLKMAVTLGMSLWLLISLFGNRI